MVFGNPALKATGLAVYRDATFAVGRHAAGPLKILFNAHGRREK